MNGKKILALAAASVMALSLAACSSGDNSSSTGSTGGTSSGSSSTGGNGNKIELEYWFEGAGPERTPVSEAIINSFNEQSADTHVNGLYVDLSSGLDKVNVAWAGGDMPDIIYTQDSWQSSMFIQGMCLDLTERFEAWDEKDQFDPDAVEAIKLKDVEGRLFAIPTASNLNGIWYRTDVFEEKGVEAPTTWDNFFAAAEKLTEETDSGKVYGYTLRGGSGAANQLLYQIVAYVGLPDFFDENGQAVILRSQEAVDFVNKNAEMYQNGWVPESSLTASFKEMVADFNAGLAMMLVHNLGSYENQKETFSPDQYAFINFPTAVNGKLTTISPNAKGLAISSTTEYPDQCWEYVKWNASEDAISDINEAVGELPTRLDSLEHDWVKNAPHMTNLPAFQAAEKQTVILPSYLPDFSTIQKQTVEPLFQEVLTGNKTAEEFLDTWASEFEAAYEEYNTQLKVQ